VQIDSDAIDLLLELVGNNMLLLSQEIQKLLLYAGVDSVINREIVAQLVPKSAEQSVFSLVERVVQRDIAGAMRMLEELLMQQEEPIKILALLANQFRLLYQVKELQQRGYAQNQAASHLGVHPYRVKLAMGQAQRFSFQELRSIIDHLADADYDMKTGKLNKRLVLENFLMRLSHK
jgi:DNA polymerase-3 subunit delta